VKLIHQIKYLFSKKIVSQFHDFIHVIFSILFDVNIREIGEQSEILILFSKKIISQFHDFFFYFFQVPTK